LPRLDNLRAKLSRTLCHPFSDRYVLWQFIKPSEEKFTQTHEIEGGTGFAELFRQPRKRLA
jgi:hypothetical protein